MSTIFQGGAVSILVAAILGGMSVISWYLMIFKGLQVTRAKRASRMFEQAFWDASSVQQGLKSAPESDSATARLAKLAVEAAAHHQSQATKALSGMCSQDEFIARSMRRTIAEEQASLEDGLTILASVGSVAPFVGLFGTVWGIYHALLSIGQSGQATIDKVAGPVGEALIMTAFGLAVAIPAVLAYNALVRGNRVIIGQLETFAHDLHTLLTTGSALNVTSIHQARANQTKEATV